MIRKEERKPLPAWQDPHKYLNYVIAGTILTAGVTALALFKLIMWLF
jgi:hypothetical protein